MPQRILIIVFPVLTHLILHSSSASAVIDPYYLNCSRPYRCSGTNINVSFPFRLPSSPSYCGIPGYELHCSDEESELSINLAGVDYRVREINYTQGFITLVESDFLGNPCPHTFTNTSINSTLFAFADLDLNLTVYINCSIPIPGLAEILCFNDLIWPRSYYKLDTGPPSFLLDLLGVCQLKAAVPVNQVAAASLNSSKAKFGEALQKGFGLKWS
ncbi:LEAF RUST 10 DISEASE-RESISTANCE LOCUS RECEPTOR-LIKE PROTEIN KINASE-like 1.2, partial [Phalaenopsis equestris]|uniref:LEAF RUST 10 DISEASE-RESISTANCE LOCUS RECEPTOR-LIKE PROTEIN KINASE-like 1.2 n=1 Tax=Phalaenopsis equestris TaxID=78828 RepID=UPI0009E2BB93